MSGALRVLLTNLSQPFMDLETKLQSFVFRIFEVPLTILAVFASQTTSHSEKWQKWVLVMTPSEIQPYNWGYRFFKLTIWSEEELTVSQSSPLLSFFLFCEKRTCSILTAEYMLFPVLSPFHLLVKNKLDSYSNGRHTNDPISKWRWKTRRSRPVDVPHAHQVSQQEGGPREAFTERNIG